MGAVWSALLVGGGLAGALILWLLRGDSGAPGKDGGAEPLKDAPPGEAAAPGGGPGGGGSGGLSPEPSDRELVSKAEPSGLTLDTCQHGLDCGRLCNLPFHSLSWCSLGLLSLILIVGSTRVLLEQEWECANRYKQGLELHLER
ncbi:similar to genethonin 1, isoform CRA_a, partial [Rattus norvegicus]